MLLPQQKVYEMLGLELLCFCSNFSGPDTGPTYQATSDYARVARLCLRVAPFSFGREVLPAILRID